MTVCLLDENQEVLQEFKPEPVTLNPECDDCSWKQVQQMQTFPCYYVSSRDYSVNMLMYVSIALLEEANRKISVGYCFINV